MSNFHQIEVVGRGSETQLQVGENRIIKIGTQRVDIRLNFISHSKRICN